MNVDELKYQVLIFEVVRCAPASVNRPLVLGIGQFPIFDCCNVYSYRRYFVIVYQSGTAPSTICFWNVESKLKNEHGT